MKMLTPHSPHPEVPALLRASKDALVARRPFEARKGSHLRVRDTHV
jgi:hypothetical protein